MGRGFGKDFRRTVAVGRKAEKRKGVEHTADPLFILVELARIELAAS